MESKDTKHSALLRFGPRERDALNRVKEEKLAPSETEAWRRGLFAFVTLADVDEYLLLPVLSNRLRSLTDERTLSNLELFSSHLETARGLAKAVRTVAAIKTGVLASEFFEMFTATCDDLLPAAKDVKLFKELNRGEVAKAFEHLAMTAEMVAKRQKAVPAGVG